MKRIGFGKKHTKHILKFLSTFMAVCMLSIVTFNYISLSQPVEAESIQELQQKIDKLEKEQKDINNKISNAKKKAKDEKEKQALLTQQISSTEQQLALYSQKITTVTKNIADKEIEIDKKLVDIDSNQEQFAKRVRAMYIQKTSSSTLSTLLSADSFSQFLNNAEILKRISQSDNDLIEELSRQQAELTKAKEDLQNEKTDLTKTKEDYEAKNNNLVSLYQQSTSEEAKLKLREKAYMEEKQAKAKEIKELEDAVTAKILAAGNSGTAPGQLAWPVPSSSRITSGFGWRTLFGRPDYHLGIDIGEKAGKSIVAAADGEVILVKKANTGYGWHVVINHGGGMSTLYGHTSRIDVVEGQQVKRGQTIAGIGTTGASTGNHLHFEVRINAKQVDPMGYVNKP